ncbi:MAG: transketolase [Rickettsiales bacterium]|nr:transketolase [Rickettsiales bacterium]
MDDKNYKLMANAIRFLSLDAVEKANSGHPGMPMGMADVATILYSEFLKFDPQKPDWQNRDRLVLSAGHGSMLIYSLLYLTGYKDITLEDLKNFRQLKSKTAGHPEHEKLSGVETTSGPLGQGLANAVGMAISQQMLENRGSEIDHHTYVICGDGCLMEGISQEAISLAGHLKLNKLIVLFDDNKISIDGPTDLTISDDTIARFKSAGWNAQSIDGHDFNQIRNALQTAHTSDKPTIIACNTVIGYGSPNKGGTEQCHGAALGPEEVSQTRNNLNWDYPPFEIPKNILKLWRAVGKKHKANNKNIDFKLPDNWNNNLNILTKKLALEKLNISTRKASSMILEALTKDIPNLLGGSADLTGSNLTKPKDFHAITADDFSGNYIYYGIREHAMAAIMNGIALYGSFIPYAGTFLVFSDYCRPAIRLSALMELQVLYIMTHDSIGLGEDGPTHQPIEHLASLRGIPNLYVFRPACSVETAECYEIAMKLQNSPSLFSLTRQNVSALRSDSSKNLSEFGGYIISPHDGKLQVTIFATGSEVEIAIEAQKDLHNINIGTRIVSIPCWEIFDQQSEEYKSELLDNSSIKIAVEAGIRQGWEKYIGRNGIFIGMKSFGASAPAKELYKYFAITKENIVQKALTKLNLG